MLRNKYRLALGFTLIEILVALLIFAIVGVIAAMSLQSMIRVHKQLKKSDASLMQLQITMTLLRRDMMEIIERPVRNSAGGTDPAFAALSSNEIIFTRAGLINPFGLSQQSNMQRVGYVLQGDKLIRLTWDVLDQPAKAKPEKQVLLNNIASLQWQFVTDNNQTSSSWPPTVSAKNQQQESNSLLPKAVLMVMHLKNQGVIQGVFPIPARGVYASQNTPTPP